MNSDALRAIGKLQGKTQSDLARIAGVSRQAVSQWFKAASGGEIGARSTIVRRLAEGLHVTADDLLRPLPCLDDERKVNQWEALFLWDRLYPSLLDFSVALVRGDESALARLVQVCGLFDASKIAGNKIWERFPRYKRQIRPQRREALERVWALRQELKNVSGT